MVKGNTVIPDHIRVQVKRRTVFQINTAPKLIRKVSCNERLLRHRQFAIYLYTAAIIQNRLNIGILLGRISAEIIVVPDNRLLLQNQIAPV